MGDETTPARRLYPPHWFFLLFALEFALDRWLPITRQLPVAAWIPRSLQLAGWVLVVAGATLGGWAALLFQRAKTGIVPFSPSSSLVLAGPYRFTRNPMYLGMATVLLGAAMILGSLTPLVSPLLFIVIVTHRFIRPEEAQMERTFGASYMEWKKRVRRWL
jgi:protein-S-isoprenylcysteine O-methyltransferase Ste14